VPAKYVMPNVFPYKIERVGFTCGDERGLRSGKCLIEIGRDVLGLYNFNNGRVPYVVAVSGCIAIYSFLAYLNLSTDNVVSIC
jgi:hypothetical protein